MTTDIDDNQQPPVLVESAACFFAEHEKCTSGDCPCDCHQRTDQQTAVAILNDIAEDGRYTSLSTVRAALFDVIDSGDQDQQPWALYEHDHGGTRFPSWTEDQASHERELFADTVVQRVIQLQSPPHRMDAGLQALVQRAEKVLTRRRRR
jgi:hypothetical protein